MLRLLLFLIKIYLKGGDEMAVIYATLIVKGRKTFADVPSVLKEKVKQVLIELDLADLAA